MKQQKINIRIPFPDTNHICEIIYKVSTLHGNDILICKVCETSYFRTSVDIVVPDRKMEIYIAAYLSENRWYFKGMVYNAHIGLIAKGIMGGKL